MEEIVEIIHATVVTESEVIQDGTVQMKNGKISGIFPKQTGEATEVLDAKGQVLVPGFIDIHIHGAGGYDVMDATEEALDGMASLLPKEGTTSFLATTMTQSHDSISAALKQAGDYMNSHQKGGHAEMLGIHLEGPYLSKQKAGAQPTGHIVPPSIEQFEAWQKDSQANIRIVTAAPEVEGGYEFFSYLKEKGVTASVGHSAATYEQAKQAVLSGATHVTHLFNQMSGFHHREPGIVGMAFNEVKLMAEIIVDHIHVHPEAVRSAYHMLGADRVVLITDAMRAKCLNEGSYDLGGQTVEVKKGEARLPDGTLAGSILRFDEAVQHMKQQLDLHWIDLVKISAANAAKQIGLFHRKGSIATGKDADFVLLDKQGHVQMTICRGTVAFDQREG